MEDIFSWGYGRGLVLAQSASGACNGQFTDINFDAVDVGIEVEATQDPGAFFSNLNLANAGGWCNDAAACHQVGIRCTNYCGSVGVVVRGMSLWGDFKQAVQWGGVRLSISDSTLESWDPEFPAMEFTSGRIGVRGVTFGTKDQNVGSVAVAIGEGVDRAIVTGNDFMGATITNNGPRTVVESELAAPFSSCGAFLHLPLFWGYLLSASPPWLSWLAVWPTTHRERCFAYLSMPASFRVVLMAMCRRRSTTTEEAVFLGCFRRSGGH